jgi:hypothetical protein
MKSIRVATILLTLAVPGTALAKASCPPVRSTHTGRSPRARDRSWVLTPSSPTMALASLLRLRSGS